MTEWKLAQSEPSEQLAKLHFFSMNKRQDDGDVEFLITVRERIQDGMDESMRFFAQADRQTNQNTAPYTPTGWGNSLNKALSECLRSIHRFPYEGPMPPPVGSSPPA